MFTFAKATVTEKTTFAMLRWLKWGTSFTHTPLACILPLVNLASWISHSQRCGTTCLRDPARRPSRRAARHFSRARNHLAAVHGVFQVLEIASHSCRAFSRC